MQSETITEREVDNRYLKFDYNTHFYFIRNLIKEHDWDEALRETLKNRLIMIDSKYREKSVNISIVGEFGTGKSTLINSLLRMDEFLVSSSLQGTTVASTIIESAMVNAIVLENDTGVFKELICNSIDELKENIVSFTTDPEIAKDIRNVRIMIKTSQLPKGYRVIDTPGINSNEAWHEDVTVRTIRETSDLFILVVDANKPITESFCDFVECNLSERLEHCIFFVTRIDMVRKRERNGIIQFIKQKLEQEFDIDNPIVLPYSSIDVLENNESELAQLSVESEEIMYGQLQKIKEITKMERIITYLRSFYNVIGKKMDEKYEIYINQLNNLVEAHRVSFESYKNVHGKIYYASLKIKNEMQKKSIIGNAEKEINNAKETIINEIDMLNEQEINRFIENDLHKKFDNAAVNVTESIIIQLKDILNNYIEINTVLDNQIIYNFNNLKRMGQIVVQKPEEVIIPGEVMKIFGDRMIISKEHLENDNMKEVLKEHAAGFFDYIKEFFGKKIDEYILYTQISLKSGLNMYSYINNNMYYYESEQNYMCIYDKIKRIMVDRKSIKQYMDEWE